MVLVEGDNFELITCALLVQVLVRFVDDVEIAAPRYLRPGPAALNQTEERELGALVEGPN